MSRTFGLDVMRVAALTMVLVAHGTALWMPAYVSELLFVATMGGFLGVEAFFVLSGFLIGALLLDLAEGQQSLARFWKRRWYRTLPNYYFFLLLNFVAAWLMQRPLGDASYLWFGQNLVAPMQVFFFPESWSLAAEEWFYLLAPLLILGLVGVAKGLGWSTTRLIVIGLLAVMIIFPLLRLDAALAGATWDSGIRKVVMLRLDALAYGVAMAAAARYASAHFAKWRLLGPLLGALGLLSVLVWSGNVPVDASLSYRTLSFSLTSLAFALMLPGLAAWKHCRSVLLTRWITRLSQWTYSAYLIHLLAIFVLLHTAGEWIGQSDLNRFTITVLWLLATLALAALVYRWYEKPLMDLRGR